MDLVVDLVESDRFGSISTFSTEGRVHALTHVNADQNAMNARPACRHLPVEHNVGSDG